MQASDGLVGTATGLGAVDHREHGGMRNLSRLVRKYPRIAGFAALLVLLWAVSLAAPLIAPYPPNAVDTHKLTLSPSASHFMGTDELGRDTFTRVLYGGRISMVVAIVAVGISSTIGIVLGLLGGYLGGWLDQLIGRWVDAQLAFPGLLLILAVVAAFGQNLKNVMVVVGLLGFPGYYRLTRGQVLQARALEYVTAAQATGVKSWRLLWRHILPNISNPLIVVTSLAAGSAILLTSTVSFLGIGAQPPEAEWGSMFFKALGDFREHPWLIFGPGIAVFLTVLSYYMLGDALRDALDPHLRGG